MSEFTTLADVHNAITAAMGDVRLLHPAIDVAWIAEQMEAEGLLDWCSGEDEDGTIWLTSQGWVFAGDDVDPGGAAFWGIVERADERAVAAYPRRLQWELMQDTGAAGDRLRVEIWDRDLAEWVDSGELDIVIEPSEDETPFVAAEDEMLARLGVGRGDIEIVALW